MIQILEVKEIPFEGFSVLLAESEKEGYNFLRRLETAWRNGTNRFSLTGEGLYRAVNDGELIGIGGINLDPFQNNKRIGRLRRFYIKQSWRKQGVGSMLLNHILENHWVYFEEITLRTHSQIARFFYEKNGFKKIPNEINHTHKIVQKTKK